MNIETVKLSEKYGIEGNATLKCFVHDRDEEMKRYNVDLPAMIVCPGGGYAFTSRREADPIAVEFYNRKYATFVLNYDVAPCRYPVALTELAAAVDYVRSNAEKFSVNPNRIFVVGFSAGGHLVANLANFWHNLPVSEANGKKLDAKPNATILGYPVIMPPTHAGSFINLTGIEDISDPRVQALSLEKSVTELNPPCFIWTTAADNAVNPDATIQYTIALKKAGVRYETHIFADGWHGLATAEERTNPDGTDFPARVWFDLADTFLHTVK